MKNSSFDPLETKKQQPKAIETLGGWKWIEKRAYIYQMHMHNKLQV